MSTPREILSLALASEPCSDCIRGGSSWGDCPHDGACWVDKARKYLERPPTNAEVYGDDPRAAHAAWEASGSRKAFSDWLLSPATGGPGR